MARTKQETREARSEAAEQLRAWFPKGSTVYTVLRSHSRSGMSRVIGVVAILDGGTTILHPNHRIATLLGMTTKGDGIKVQGGGMDMGFHLAYELASELYGDGYALNHRWI